MENLVLFNHTHKWFSFQVPWGHLQSASALGASALDKVVWIIIKYQRIWDTSYDKVPTEKLLYI